MSILMIVILFAVAMSVGLMIVECISVSDSTGRSVAIMPLILVMAVIALALIQALPE